MRACGRNETDSLYFDYPYFEAPQRSTGKERESIRVAIIGAGPVGMTAALALAKENIACVLFDNKSTFNDGSRAICIARPSYYIFEYLGVIKPFLEKSLGWTMGRSFYRGQQILEFKMPDSSDEKFRPMYNLQQQYIEQFLWQAVAANDLIETRWQSTVEDTEDFDDGVRLTVTDPAGEYQIDAEWVLACDGARSKIRHQRGLRLKGENFEGRYVIADIQMNHDYPTIRRALFDPNCRPGGTVLIHRQPDNIWRIDYQLKEDESTEEAIEEAIVRTNVQAVLDDIDYTGTWQLEWWSVYSANTLALDDYRDGRVFFVGDSAHIVPIFGVRGLNNGLADAANIGWKLGWVLNNQAGEELLNSYSPERHGATLDVFANASKSARFMTPGTHGWRLMRDAALALALEHSFAGALANPRQMTAYTYSDSPAVKADEDSFDHGPVVGAILQDIAIGDGFLSNQLGTGFTALCFNQELAQKIRAAAPDDGRLSVVCLPDSSHLAKTYDANAETIYLIRPDMHIAARCQYTEASSVLNAYNEITFNIGTQQ
ncbi:MAG: 3-(3-hydroxy-phenyl)propionate hydroxylase [Parasphingorhabdus sp.]|jgi:3-(3-hydroxy-phenyl)propionate hydroxylase